MYSGSMNDVKVISLGGSLVMPDTVDADFIREFKSAIDGYLSDDHDRKLIIVVGGGKLARRYQDAYRKIVNGPLNDEADWIGITATYLNAQLLKAVFGDHCRDEVVKDPTAVSSFEGRILIGAGWKPGFSTDNDAVILADRFGADTLINVTNIAKVFTADPDVDKTAKPIDKISWEGFRAIIGNEWKPGANAPFDPVAAKLASEIGLKVISADGSDIENLKAILNGRPFTGTTIGPV